MLSCSKLSASALLAAVVSLSVLAGPARAAAHGTLPADTATAVSAAVQSAVQTAMHDGAFVGDDDIHWD
jgi:hypothetical protein